MKSHTALATKLGKILRARRVEMGLSQDDFADRIQMHRAYYSAIERGEKNITLATLRRVAVGLQLRMSELLAQVD
jgi:transcriptional regulator with XRE-family HTH domain